MKLEEQTRGLRALIDTFNTLRGGTTTELSSEITEDLIVEVYECSAKYQYVDEPDKQIRELQSIIKRFLDSRLKDDEGIV